jgi:hypothetical protein
MGGDHYQHLKSGGLYEVIAEGLMECDLRPVVIYRGVHDGQIWVRPTDEFFDGRFVDAAPPAKGER